MLIKEGITTPPLPCQAAYFVELKETKFRVGVGFGTGGYEYTFLVNIIRQ
jgi:hypothetical protein